MDDNKEVELLVAQIVSHDAQFVSAIQTVATGKALHFHYVWRLGTVSFVTEAPISAFKDAMVRAGFRHCNGVENSRGTVTVWNI